MEQFTEQQRVKYETEINRLTIIVREQEKTLLDRSGKILSLEEVLAKKTDVER
jgi:hypothetical protein